jgi:hypothetical protein
MDASRLSALVVGCALWGAVGWSGAGASGAERQAVSLNVADLHAGFEARKVVLEGERLALDPRVFRFGAERRGVVATDPVDLGPSEGLIGLPATVRSVAIEVQADVPEGAAVTLEARSGVNPLDTAQWSPWQRLDGLKATVEPLAGRCLQVRVTLTASSAERVPALRRLVLLPTVRPGRAWRGTLEVAEQKIRRIVRSPIEFHYERPDQEQIVRFRKLARLDAVVAGARDDFEKLVKLMHWVGSCTDDRTTRRERNGRVYTWDIARVFTIEDGTPTVHGHCMSYAEVMVSAAVALGYVGARHMAICGFREASHEVCDIWVPSLGKWVYFDPSLTQTYFDKATHSPLNLIEMHTVVADTFLRGGEDMHWWRQRGSQATRDRVRGIGGQKPIGCRTGPWHYGKPAKPDYDWGFYHGYLAAGFVQMTPRNDFQSHPEAVPRQFEHYPGYAGYPFWVDAKTPPTRGGHNWYTRHRDFYWTLDQAGLRLVQADEGELRVELGHSMPFFKSYRIRADGRAVGEAGSPFIWRLKPGRNHLAVAPVDEFGKVGLASQVTVRYAP